MQVVMIFPHVSHCRFEQLGHPYNMCSIVSTWSQYLQFGVLVIFDLYALLLVHNVLFRAENEFSLVLLESRGFLMAKQASLNVFISGLPILSCSLVLYAGGVFICLSIFSLFILLFMTLMFFVVDVSCCFSKVWFVTVVYFRFIFLRVSTIFLMLQMSRG